MTDTVLPRLRKSWHSLRRRVGAGATKPCRLVIEKVKWLNGARSPVMLMVDDLTNAWHSRHGGGPGTKTELGWGLEGMGQRCFSCKTGSSRLPDVK